MVDQALYGRMRLGKCVEIDMGHIGCYTDVLATADRRCSGRMSCEIRVPDAELENTRPCLKELKTYLEVSFRCLTGTLLLQRSGVSPTYICKVLKCNRTFSHEFLRQLKTSLFARAGVGSSSE